MFLYQIQIEPKDSENCGMCEFSHYEEYSGEHYCDIFGEELKSTIWDRKRCDKCKQAEQDTAK